MKYSNLKVLAAAFALASVPLLRADAAPAETISITANDSMRFSVTRIEAHPGQTVTVRLLNTGTLPKTAMGHNWILLRAGSDVIGYATTAISAAGSGYQPQSLSGEVLSAIPLLGPRQTGEVTFTAPTSPGRYPFLCSFPGHAQAGMQGVLVVR